MNNNTSENGWGSTVGERIMWLRKLFGLSRRDLYHLLVENYPDTAPSYTAIQGWEMLGKIPRPEKLKMLSNFFQCPESFILAKSEDFGKSSKYMLQISVSELHLYDGEPVLITLTTKSSVISSYALVNAEQKYLVFNDKQSIPFDKISSNAKIYCRNLYNEQLSFDPISLEMAKKLDKVYIMEQNCIPQTSRYAGYYRYNIATDSFEREDHKVLLRADAFGISYQAYARAENEKK